MIAMEVADVTVGRENERNPDEAVDVQASVRLTDLDGKKDGDLG